MPVFFNGQLLVSPATVSQVDDTAMFNRNANVGNVLAIIGSAKGGKPKTALRFGSPEEARSALLGGEALKAIEKAFDPSSETAGPAQVVFVRVDPATQSALTLKDGSAANVITLASTQFGKVANQIKVKIENGSVSGKKVTTQLGNDVYSADNVARNAFSVTYTGANATATIAVDSDSVTLTDSGSTVLDLADFPTVGQLVDRINAVAGWAATVLDGNLDHATEQALDGVTAGNAKNTTVTVTANLQAIVDFFNGIAEGFVTATRVNDAVTVPANIAFTYLSGAVDGEVQNSDWQAAFDVLQAIDVQWVVPLSANAAIHAMADVHCGYMSNVGRMERRAVVGDATGITDANAITAAKALNSDRTSYLHLGIYDFDENGALKLYPAYIAAALVAGAFAGMNPGTPLTNKSLKIRGIERELRNPTDTDALILGGVLCIESSARGFRVVKSISTWLNNANYNRVEVSCGVATDFVARSVRASLDEMRGKKASPSLLSEAVSRTDTILRGLAQAEPIGPGVLVGDKASPAFKNITASLDGDVVKVEFQCSPVIPANYITVGIHAVPYSGNASA